MTMQTTYEQVSKAGLSTVRPSIDTLPYERGRIVVKLLVKEFTAVCPKTGLPDFGTIFIEYIPNGKILESKSLKYYMLSFRNEGIFGENIVYCVHRDITEACQPQWLFVRGRFASRGGIEITVEKESP